ncbi:alpha/beta fold hydrolase [Ramlibacter algicola]|uniref:Alpha/beta fold hydrolase n=1 Tax=Ramlibacter algicola TaxID=2795217 RepID=A0A934Q1Y2_9BURK|nr:alpha/beta fold hydrolase [Ramlibacter algicola]MBK0394534.1 alpha/beta fold hydrolase [Ramlibacter algicola]
MKQEQLRTPDGAQITVRSWDPAGQPHGSVVIGGAMGVRQDYYAPFAGWLAAQGWRVTTFDYRGHGLSLPEGQAMRDVDADLFDWARDYEAVIDHAHAALPQAPLHLIGHSLGAQLPGLLRNQHKVAGLLSVAAGSGYWRENAPRLKRTIWYFWWVLVPLATRLCGYFPGKRLKKVGDLPKGVILQWRRWCLDPRYSVGAEGEQVRRQYASARFPLLALSITDDELMTLRGTHSLVGLYENAQHEVVRLAPADVQQRRLGHFGAFRASQQAALWPRMLQWLHTLSPATA